MSSSQKDYIMVEVTLPLEPLTLVKIKIEVEKYKSLLMNEGLPHEYAQLLSTIRNIPYPMIREIKFRDFCSTFNELLEEINKEPLATLPKLVKIMLEFSEYREKAKCLCENMEDIQIEAEEEDPQEMALFEHGIFKHKDCYKKADITIEGVESFFDKYGYIPAEAGQTLLDQEVGSLEEEKLLLWGFTHDDECRPFPFEAGDAADEYFFWSEYYCFAVTPVTNGVPDFSKWKAFYKEGDNGIFINPKEIGSTMPTHYKWVNSQILNAGEVHSQYEQEAEYKTPPLRGSMKKKKLGRSYYRTKKSYEHSCV